MMGTGTMVLSLIAVYAGCVPAYFALEPRGLRRHWFYVWTGLLHFAVAATVLAVFSQLFARRLQGNPLLGAFHLHSKLKQTFGIDLGPRTFGRPGDVVRWVIGTPHE